MSPARNRTQPSGSRRAAGKTRAAARKNQKNSQPKPGGQHVATGPGSYALVLALLFWLWQPVGATVWSLPGPGTGLYGRIRHPLMAGFMVVFWSAPVITAGHLLFAAAAAGYILADIAFEEHDLIQSLGGIYTAYRARVPRADPRPRLRRYSPRSLRTAAYPL